MATTIADAQIIDVLAAGHSLSQAADMLGRHKQTIHRRAKQLRPLIEAASLAYFEANVPLATRINAQCLQAAAKLYDSLPPAELSAHAPLLNQAHKISDRILQSVGIAPALAPSITVAQFVQVSAVTILAPQLQALFSPASLQAATSDDIVDAEWDELAEEGP